MGYQHYWEMKRPTDGKSWSKGFQPLQYIPKMSAKEAQNLSRALKRLKIRPHKMKYLDATQQQQESERGCRLQRATRYLDGSTRSLLLLLSAPPTLSSPRPPSKTQQVRARLRPESRPLDKREEDTISNRVLI